MTPPGAGARPSGFAGRLHLTVPLATLLGLADRPGEIPGLGPVDPWLARDLARAAAANPATTWCLTVTDQQGHAIGHGCARPAPKNRARRPPGGPDPPDPPGRTSRDRPGFTFGPHDRDGPPGGYGPGGSPPASPGSATWPSRWTRSRPGRVITGSRPPGMIRAASCGTWPRSGTRPVPPPPAGGPPPRPTSSTTSPTRRAAGPVCATAARNADTTTGSSSTPTGKSSRSPPPPSAGPPHPVAAAPPNPPGTRSEERPSEPHARQPVDLGIDQHVTCLIRTPNARRRR